VSGLEASVHVKASAPPPAGTVPHGHPSGASVYLAFRQDGVTYWRRPFLVTDVWTPGDDPEGDWDAGGAEISLDDDFVHYDETGAIVNGGPDFADGGAIEVGLLFSMTSQFAAHPNAFFHDAHGPAIERPFGFDDFEVVLHRADVDADGYDDEADNCIWMPNGTGEVAQCDTDMDGYGNACDGDFDQNLSTNANDGNKLVAESKPPGAYSGMGTDMNCDGSVDANDFMEYFLRSFDSGKPGPSGLACAGIVPCDP
jgi:hypothetical protein